ncbi:MAG: hypothetical protein IIB65_08580 [Proteobacteria bacterium]|nr:hypothetical protein [Pseudomonadota bacterium]MCH8097305.1 hypothetical protein [Pseudomonadota bacterium]
MSALGHYLEEEGIPTTGISLVREHTEGFRPPRFLWVPFELGRPFGAPDDPEFQMRVLRAALALLESEDGPVLLVDFPEDAPVTSEEGAAWACPVNLAPPPREQSQLGAALAAEMGALAPWYDLAVRTRGRTTVGASGMDIQKAADFIAGFLAGKRDNPPPGVSLAEALKLTFEDIKAWYLEAATARPGSPPSDVLADWFWGETVAGHILLDLYRVCLASDDEGLLILAKGFFLPRSQMHRLDR